jgi:5-methylcytosine-specific restriction endonuclease McrA
VPRRINKKQKKLTAGECLFCGTDDYSVLDVHRIVPGEEGGVYSEFNTVVACSNCHRKVHAGLIKIIGKHFSTAGRYLVNYVDEDGAEKWK